MTERQAEYFSPQPKVKIYRNQDFLDFIRSKPCNRCGKLPRSEAHHVRRSYWGSGTARKPHDYVAVSRCHDCHKPEHEYNVEIEIINNLIAYIEKLRK